MRVRRRRRGAGRAGGSARRRYEELRRRWLRRLRWRIALVSAVAALVAVAATWATADASQTYVWLAGFLSGAFAGAIFSVRHSPPAHIANWELGAWGEQATARRLRRLRGQGWHIRHDIERRWGNLDHVVVGPPGAFLLDSKWLTGNVSVSNGVVTVRRYEDPADSYQDAEIAPRMRGLAREVNARLREHGAPTLWVSAVVVVWGGFEERHVSDDRVDFVAGEILTEWLLDQRPRYSRNEVAALAKALSAIPEFVEGE